MSYCPFHKWLIIRNDGNICLVKLQALQSVFTLLNQISHVYNWVMKENPSQNRTLPILYRLDIKALESDKEDEEGALSSVKSPKERREDYAEAIEVVGVNKIHEMEQMMRDKLQQRTKTGPFQLRKTFKYFDRDGSGGKISQSFSWRWSSSSSSPLSSTQVRTK